MVEPQIAVQFTPLDWVWAALLILVMVVSGVLFYRLGRRSEADFFLAGRGLPWWLPATSVYATHTATDTPMWITGTVYMWGARGVWYPFFAAWALYRHFAGEKKDSAATGPSGGVWRGRRSLPSPKPISNRGSEFPEGTRIEISVAPIKAIGVPFCPAIRPVPFKFNRTNRKIHSGESRPTVVGISVFVTSTNSRSSRRVAGFRKPPSQKELRRTDGRRL